VANHTTKVKVEVLLATYNGEKYLAEQLDSLLAQSDVIISLLVSDDGSQDKTLEILCSYKDLFHEFQLFHGPGKGPQSNFFFLLQQSKGEFVALCDQDDIWEKNHLIKSVNRLTPGKASVTFSAVREFSRNPAGFNRIWPKKIRIYSIENILFENPARGCTIVMTRPFVDIVRSKVPKVSIMHDWWIVLVALGGGYLSSTGVPEVNYRIHENNAVGATPQFSIKMRRLASIFVSGSLSPLWQIRELDALHSPRLTDQVTQALTIWRKPVRLPSLLRQLLGWSRYRSNLFEEILLRITFLRVWIREGAKK
jgi:glycosyltransferase involved in cell wall biosynthesis